MCRRELEMSDIDNRIAEIKSRIASKSSTLNMGIDPTLFGDAVELGGLYLQKGTQEFPAWSAKMRMTFGNEIEPHLEQIWQTLQKNQGVDKEIENEPLEPRTSFYRKAFRDAIAVILCWISLVLSALITLSEVMYYLAHPYRPGVAPHIIVLGLAVVCSVVAQLVRYKAAR